MKTTCFCSFYNTLIFSAPDVQDYTLDYLVLQVRKKYFLNVDMENEEEFRPRYLQLLTDLLFTRCTDRFARLLANQGSPPDLFRRIRILV